MVRRTGSTRWCGAFRGSAPSRREFRSREGGPYDRGCQDVSGARGPGLLVDRNARFRKRGRDVTQRRIKGAQEAPRRTRDSTSAGPGFTSRRDVFARSLSASTVAIVRPNCGCSMGRPSRHLVLDLHTSTVGVFGQSLREIRVGPLFVKIHSPFSLQTRT